MHTTRYTDISITLSQFLLKLAGVWMTVNNAEERRRRLTMAFTAVIHVYGLYLNLGDAYYTWNDLSVSIKIGRCFKIVIFQKS